MAEKKILLLHHDVDSEFGPTPIAESVKEIVRRTVPGAEVVEKPLKEWINMHIPEFGLVIISDRTSYTSSNFTLMHMDPETNLDEMKSIFIQNAISTLKGVRIHPQVPVAFITSTYLHSPEFVEKVRGFGATVFHEDPSNKELRPNLSDFEDYLKEAFGTNPRPKSVKSISSNPEADISKRNLVRELENGLKDMGSKSKFNKPYYTRPLKTNPLF